MSDCTIYFSDVPVW